MKRNLLPLLLSITCLFIIQQIQAQSTKKNLLFIMTDQQRYDALGYAGNTVIQTPNMDRLAQQGAFFRNAYTPCAVCGPARSSILTGSTVENTGVNSNSQTYYDVPEGVMTMPSFDQILSENGYHCEYYGKWHAATSHANIYQNPVQTSNNGSSVFGPGGQSHIWRDHLGTLGDIPVPGDGQFVDGMSKYPYNANPIDRFYGMSWEQLVSSGQKHSQPDQHGELTLDKEHTLTGFQAKQTLEAITRLKDSTFSITCSFHFPHSPMVLPPPYYGMYPVDEMVPPVSINDDMQNSPYINSNSRQNRTEYTDPEKVKYMISEYYGLITEIDDWVGVILDTLETLGIADNTMIVFMSDHGEMLGAHGMREKNVFYEESAHVPLFISNPGEIQSETTVEGYVSLIDIFPTILDYLEMPEHESDGKSLRGLMEGTDTTHGKYVVTEWDRDGISNYMIVQDGWKLMIPYKISSTVINAMYDLNTDPHEMNNLLGSNPSKADYIEKAEELRASLLEWLDERNSVHYYSVSKRDLLNGGKPTGNNAAFVSQDIPALNAGETVNVSITMRNSGSTAWTKNGNFKLGSQSPADNNTWGLTRIELDEQDSILPGEEKTFSFEITVPSEDGIYNFQWQMIQEGEEWFGAKSDIKQVLFGNPGSFWDDCDALTDWKSSAGLVLNTTDQQQGTGCIEFSSGSTDEFKKVFSTPYDTRGSEETTELRFWYYVSDVSLHESGNQVEIGSAGRPDQDEYSWNLTGLSNGWNYLVLKTSEAGKMGSPDLSSINWFRIYRKKTGAVTSRIDALQLIDPTAPQVYTLLINNGNGGGSYLEGEEVTITAYSPGDGRVFDMWLIDSGDPEITDVYASTTTLTMGTSSAVVSASYRETQNYSVTVNNGTGGGEFSPGATVTIQAPETHEGEDFNKWIVNAGEISLSNEYSAITYFNMPEEDVEVTATYGEATSISQIGRDEHLVKIFPNPAKTEVTIDIKAKQLSEIEISLFDLSGRSVGQIYEFTNLNSDNHQVVIPVSEFNQGIYNLKIEVDGVHYTKLLMVK